MGLFDKKFKTKIKHYSHGYFTVSYSYYRWFPKWKGIDLYAEEEVGVRLGAGQTRIFTKREAKLFLEDIKTIDDIRNITVGAIAKLSNN